MFLALLEILKELVLPAMGYMGCAALFSRPETPPYFSNHLAFLWCVVGLGCMYMPRIWFHRMFLTPELGLEIAHVLNVFSVHVTFTLLTETMDRMRYITMCAGCACLMYLYGEPKDGFVYYVMLAWMGVDVIRSIYTLLSVYVHLGKVGLMWPLLLTLGLPAYMHIYQQQRFGMEDFAYLNFLIAIHDAMTTTSDPGEQDPLHIQPTTAILTERKTTQPLSLDAPQQQTITDFDWTVTLPQTLPQGQTLPAQPFQTPFD